MDNQSMRDDLTGESGRSKPVGTYAGAATPADATAVGEPLDVGSGMGGMSGGESGAGGSFGEGATTGAASSGGATAKMDAGLDKAAGGIDKLVDVIRDRGESMGQSSGAAGTVGSVATAAAGKLEGASQYLHQTDTDHLKSDLEALIRRRPIESLLTAAGIGFLLAKALR